MSKLPPSRSWSGDWEGNKVPYRQSSWSGRDRKPPRRSRKMLGCLGWFLFACAAAIFLAYLSSR